MDTNMNGASSYAWRIIFGAMNGKVLEPGPFVEPYKVEPGLNRDDVIINLIIILNINKYIKLVKIEKNR